MEDKTEHRHGCKGCIPLTDMVVDTLRARGIRKDTCEKYGYFKTTIHDEPAQVAC